jgi:hypothetical protein
LHPISLVAVSSQPTGGTRFCVIVTVLGQPERIGLIGVLMAYVESEPEGQAWVAAFRKGLQKARIGTHFATPERGGDATFREGTRHAAT